jgi:predicted amidohydrolase
MLRAKVLSTTKPAEVIGKLKPGACADITIFKLREGKFVYEDTLGEKRVGGQKLEPIHVVREGNMII